MKKQVCCIRCGIRLHPTDWEILKYNNQMPICDECDIKYSNENKKILNASLQLNYCNKVK
ncbi:hypothetical protein [Fictibacillus arsenicus]|uniref:Uncharacterized protein n=1 Tax=Fictibacillus arsenicus TaxID=255247 RepID=A0A1V3G882_9BACL|nr:hypothetical protein [Fictibacillus arsenicus]OOE12487.1 hypothetical protein UN64_10400 [Fictibacillus arsenicus]